MYKLDIVVLILTTVFVQNHVHSEIITNLPGLDTPINFKQYSGYISLDSDNGTRLFYWFVESQSDPSNDPLVLWLNGGPGCSSLIGFLEELGPFYVKPDLTLGMNEYSWNKIANMLFLEAPAGVGFSKTNQEFQYNDERTASDSLTFLLKFFEKYPHLKTNAFWMAGESYAGHYVPNLAAKVIEHNKVASNDAINLKGLMLGNPLTVGTIDFGATYDYVFAHDLISQSTYRSIVEYCNLTFHDPPPNRHLDPAKCEAYQEAAANEMGPINPYSIYTDVCLNKGGFRGLLDFLANSKVEMSGYAKGFMKQKTLRSPYFPCQDNYIRNYLNDPAVQKAIHAEPTKWKECSVKINLKYSKSDVLSSILPFYSNILFGRDLKILIFSGDVDTVVCTTGTRRWINELGLRLKAPWAPWMDSNNQVGGYVEVYDQLTFATVRNAGHEVPTFQPSRAYDMFSGFLNG